MSMNRTLLKGSNSCRTAVLLSGLLICILYLLPFLIRGSGICLPIFDDLDDCLIKYKVLSASHALFGSSQNLVEPLMNGLPRSSYPSELNIVTLLFAFFPPLVGYAVNQVLIHGIAFFSMARFLKTHIKASETMPVLLILVSAGFAMLPFYPYAGIAVAGLPLLLNAFLNLYHKKQSKYDWVILALFPFYSSLFYQGLFSIFLLLAFCCIFAKRINRHFLMGVFLFTAFSAIAEYRVILQVLFSEIPSQRLEFKPWLLMNYYKGWSNAWAVARLVLSGQRNDIYSSHPFPFHTALFVVSGVVFFLKKDFRALKALAVCLAAIVLIASLSALNFSAVLIPLREKHAALNMLQFDRFYNLLPPLYYVLFFYCCVHLCGHFKPLKWLLPLAASAQLLFLLNFNFSFKESVKAILHAGKQGMTYSEYYSPDLFQTIRKSIGTDQQEYRVLCIGLNPAIPLYNGFYNIDGHISDYPLSYKKQFRLLIEKELAKNKYQSDFFDYYGSRCYAFPAELDLLRDYTKNDKKKITHLELNTAHFQDYKNLYVFSGVRIINAPENKLRFIGEFENGTSPWRIYVYKTE